MTDFYSVLRTSIIKRGLRSAAARHEVYDQAREAMIRRLWSFDPPLSEDEIDARIGLFDAAVEKIEIDLERSLAPARTINRTASRASDGAEPTDPSAPRLRRLRRGRRLRHCRRSPVGAAPKRNPAAAALQRPRRQSETERPSAERAARNRGQVGAPP